MKHTVISFSSILRIFFAISYSLLDACSSSSDEPPPDDPATSSTWGEMKCGEGTWGE